MLSWNYFETLWNSVKCLQAFLGKLHLHVSSSVVLDNCPVGSNNHFEFQIVSHFNRNCCSERLYTLFLRLTPIFPHLV